jgi:hypothetical protein
MSGTLRGVLDAARNANKAEAEQIDLEEPIAKREPRKKALSPAAHQSHAEPATRGKSSNPDYERLTVYVRKDTRKAAARKWEDSIGGDLSDLVQDLLTKYLIA